MSKVRSLLIASTLLGFLSTTCYAIDNVATRVKWGYQGNIGPADWAKLNPNFILCANGKEQSPIDIPYASSKQDAKLSINYVSAPFVIVDDGTTDLTIGKTQMVFNDGHGIQLNFPESTKEYITYDGHRYRLVQFHMHTPSETKVHGEAMPLEIHFVHQGENGSAVVIGVFVTSGPANKKLQEIIDHLPREKGKEMAVDGLEINPLELLPNNRNYYSFPGSLTTPPCAEGIQWIVMSDSISASPEQIEKLKKAMNGNNARPVQSLNDRKVIYNNK